MSHLINKKFFAILSALVLLFIFILPVISLAENIYTPLIRCGLPSGQYNKPCNFNEFVGLINRIINWIISMAGVLFTVAFVYGGYLYMTAGENSGNKEKAKNLLTTTVMGFVVVLTAWLIIYTLLTYLVPEKTTIFKFINKINN